MKIYLILKTVKIFLNTVMFINYNLSTDCSASFSGRVVTVRLTATGAAWRVYLAFYDG